MFSVYGITGQVYSGAFEGISRVNQVRQTRQSRTVQEDGFELGADIIPSQFPAKSTPPTAAEQRAINAYRRHYRSNLNEVHFFTRDKLCKPR